MVNNDRAEETSQGFLFYSRIYLKQSEEKQNKITEWLANLEETQWLISVPFIHPSIHPSSSSFLTSLEPLPTVMG